MAYNEGREIGFASLDGLRLVGTFHEGAPGAEHVVVLVHGGGASRHEGGFFTRLAEALTEAAVPNLRFDLRAHGASAGDQAQLTLSGVLNDIRAADSEACRLAECATVDLIGTSFSGGLVAYYAARHPNRIHRLVCLNPLMDYKGRFIDEKPYWNDDRLDAATAAELSANGYLVHSPTFRLGRALLNEVFYLRPADVLGEVTAPALVVHGTSDTFVPVDSSRRHVALFGGEARLVEIAGAQHGFAVHDDPGYADPQTQLWQAQVIDTVVGWITAGPPSASP